MQKMRHIEQKHQLSLKEFERFFRENFQAASLVAFRYISDRSLVEDIVQESFVILWKRQSEIFTNKEDLKKYLFVTVRNRTISYLRSIKIQHVNLDASLTEAVLPESEKLYDDEELSIRIFKAVQKLPPKCKEIFMLAYIGNLTYNDIAGRLLISKNTVKTQMVIAYRILRDELKELYFDLLFLFFKRDKFFRQ
ncbi:MAG: sigma-70 family RNA polymerase sigma factor [Mangrovibacterium sp.]